MGVQSFGVSGPGARFVGVQYFVFLVVLGRRLQYSFAVRAGGPCRGGLGVNRMLSVGWGFLTVLFLLVASASAVASTAYFKVGNDLIASCEGTAAGEQQASTAEYLLCLGYLQAVVDTDATFAEWGDYPRQACIPQGTTSSQLREVFLKWISERPDYHKFSAASLALTAYSEAWPCKKE